MPQRVVRTFKFDSRSPWAWLIALVAIAVAVVLALVFFTIFLGLLGLAIVATPFLLWRRRRAVERRHEPGVIDVEEYEISPKLPEE